jgi:hypothetical protein
VFPADSTNLVRTECQIDKVRAEDTMTSRVGSNHEVVLRVRGLDGTGSSGVVETVNACRI